MSFDKKINFLVLFLFLFLTSNIYLNQDDHEIELSNLDDSTEQKIQDRYLYLKGTHQHMINKKTEALQTLGKMSNGSPGYAYNEKIRLYFNVGQFDKIIALKDKIKEFFKDSWELQFILANAYLETNRNQEAEELLQELIDKYPANEQIAYYRAVSYIKNMQLAKALEFIDECLKKPSLRSRHFLFYFLKSKVYMQMHMHQMALQAITRSLKIYPKFERSWLLKALIEEQMGKVNDAIAGYKNYLDIFGHDLGVEKQLAQLLFSQDRFKEAADVLRNMDVDNPMYNYTLALTEWKARNYNKAKIAVDKALKAMPDLKRAKLLNIDILLGQGKKDEALQFLQDWLQSAPEDPAIVHFVLLLRRVGISNDKIINLFENVITKDKKSVPILAVLADLYLEKNNYNQALKYCDNIISLIKDDRLRSRVLFQKAHILFTTKQEDNIESTLQDSIKCLGVYPGAYNLLAYYYAQQDKNLDKALNLANLALQSISESSYFLDTKGYVLYKLGKYGDAVSTLTKALNIDPKDQVIKEHLNLAKSKL